MQTVIASRSISPYMWMSTGPISKKPLEGDGIEAITRGAFCPSRETRGA